MKLKDKKTLVVGFRKSGLAAAKFLALEGARVTVTDIQDAQEFEAERKALEGLRVKYSLGGHKLEDFITSELIVLSPRVKPDTAELKAARSKGIPILGELEIAFNFLKQPLIGITGTNGKSTVCKLIAEMLEKEGLRIFLGGNIGLPLTEALLCGEKFDAAVCEVSSFQLQSIESFKPKIAVLLNIARDHLDWHTNFEEYLNAKRKIFINQNASDFAILNADQPQVIDTAQTIHSKVYTFSMKKSLSRGAWIEGKGFLICKEEEKPVFFNFENSTLSGLHNLQNIMASALCASIFGASPRAIQSAVRDFAPLPHRMEFIKNVRGVKFINDSKATNVDAATKAVEAFAEPLILIAGGRNKGMDFGPLVLSCREKVKMALFFGESARDLKKAFQGVCPTKLVPGIEEAIKECMRDAKPGTTVLFSPACSSFDMFSNFEERGMKFKEAVFSIAN